MNSRVKILPIRLLEHERVLIDRKAARMDLKASTWARHILLKEVRKDDSIK